MADSPERAAEHTEIVIRVLESLGLVIKKRKSILKPTHTIPFLGFIVNSLKMLLLLPEEKLKKIKVIYSNSSGKYAHSQRNIKFLRSVPSSSASFADGSPPLQGCSERLNSGNFSARRQSKLRYNQGSTLVDSRPCTSKWQGDYSSKSGFSNFLGCFEGQVGSSSLRIQQRMSLERARCPRPYKLLGAGSSISGSQSFFASYKREACPVWPGQPHCSSAHQMAGRYKISAPHSITTRHMVLRTRREHDDISNSCAGK